MKNAPKKIEVNSDILNQILELSIDGVLVVNEKGKILKFNRRFIEIWGVPAKVVEAGIDAPVLKAVMDKLADPKAFLVKVKYLYSSHEEISWDEVVLKDGTVLDRYSAPVLGTDKKYIGRVWYFRDVTDKKKIEREIIESESKYQAIVSGSQDAIVMMNNKGKITSWNLGAERMFGYKEKEVLGKDLHLLIAVEKDHRENKKHLNVFFKTGISPVIGKVVELPVKNKKGKVFTIELSVSATQLDNEWYGVGMMRDVTERKKVEKNLAEEKMLMETLINAIPDYIISKNIKGQYLMCNKAFAEKLVGKSREEILGRTDRQLFQKNLLMMNFILEKDQGVMKEGKNVKEVWEANLADGQVVKLETIKTRLLNKIGKVIGLVGVSRDVTERYKNDEELKERVRSSEILNKVMVDREIKMIELKKEIANLKKNGH
jgi:PAS domain S-box-containing protein